MKIQLRKQVGAVLGLALFVVSFAAFADEEVVPVEVATNLTLVTSPQDGNTAFSAAETESYLANLRQHKNEGNAVGTALTVDVDEGKTLTVGRLRGGRGHEATLTKTGAGTLRLHDAAPYGGMVVLQGGTLDLSLRKIPTADELPAGPILHVDATDISNFTTEEENGKTYVKFWKNDANAAGDVGGLQQYLRQRFPKHFRPWLVKDAIGPGLHVVDFGLNNFNQPFKPNSTNPEDPWTVEHGAFSYVAEENYDEPQTKTLSGVRTLVAVSGAQRGGGTILNYSGSWGYKPFDRGVNWIGSGNWQAGVGKDYSASNVTYPASVWQDGIPTVSTQGYETPGFHVIAIQQDPVNAKCQLFGSSSDGNGHIFPGGCILGEVFVYDRVLSETELRDVQAYLMNKWFKMAASGYARDDGFANLQNVSVAAPATLYVPEGQTNRLDSLAINAAVTVSGGGTLEVFDMALEGDIIYEGTSEIRIVDRPDAGDMLCAVPPGASFRLDATAVNSFCFRYDASTGAPNPANGTNIVRRVVSWGGGNVMAIQENYPPRYAENVLNGLPMIDFGWKCSYGSMLNFYPLDGLRDVFIVHKGDSGDLGQGTVEDHSYDGGCIIGSDNYTAFGAGNENAKIFDYFRGPNKKGATSGVNWNLVGNNSSDCMQSGWADAYFGSTFNAGAKLAPSGEFEQIEIIAKCPTHASAVKCSVGYSQYCGGGFVGELALYERTLTPREQTQMRNYLAKKWFKKTDAELETLPPKPASRAGRVSPTIVIVDGGTVVVGETTSSNVIFRGHGQIVKTGEETVVQSTDFNGFTGTVTVAEGTLTVDGYQTQREGKRKTDDVIARFVVGEGLVTEQSGSVTKVKEWHSTEGGYYLVRSADSTAVALGHDGAIRSDYVNLGSYGMWIYKDGVPVVIDGIRAVAWALGSQAGGGALLGGHKSVAAADGIGWHRGGGDSSRDPGTDWHDPLLNVNNHHEGLKLPNAMWRVNERTVDPEKGYLSGGWDAIAVNETNMSATALNAASVAIEPRSGGIRQGHQRLLELVFYGEPMTEDELLDNEAYLMNKWHLFNAVGPASNEVDLVLAADTTLSAGGHNQYFKSLEGEGATVADGGIKPQTLVYDFAKAGVLTVEGAFEFRPGFTVELRNAPDYFEPVKVATAATVEGLANYTKDCVTGGRGGPVLICEYDADAGCYALYLRYDGVRLNGESMTLDQTHSLSNFTIVGEGELVKRGDYEMETADLAQFTGRLEIAEGRFIVSGIPAEVPPQMATEGQTLRFDMSEGVVTTAQSSDGTKTYPRIVANLATEADEVATIRTYNSPTVLEKELNGLPVVDMPAGNCMKFYDAAGNPTYLHDIQSIFWVIGSQNGGGFLMGGGTNAHNGTHYPWHRGGNGGYGADKAGDALHNSNAQTEILNGSFRRNFESVGGSTTGLTGGYDILSVTIKEDPGDGTWAPMNAQGFAYDGRDINHGYQRLGEVIVYNRRLDIEEVKATEAYLAVKWGFRAHYGETGAGVAVAAGATLDCGGLDRTFVFIEGAGTVENGGVKTAKLVYDFDNPGTLTVDGTFTFGEGFLVEVTGEIPADLPNTGVKILSATAFANKENFSRAAVTGVDTEKYVLKLRKDGLYLAPVNGALLLVR